MEIGAQDDIFAASASTSSKRHLADDDELEDSPDTKILKKSTVTRLRSSHTDSQTYFTSIQTSRKYFLW